MDYYTQVSNAIEEAVKEIIPDKPRAQLSWFVIAKEKLSKLIEERNSAIAVSFQHRTLTPRECAVQAKT